MKAVSMKTMKVLKVQAAAMKVMKAMKIVKVQSMKAVKKDDAVVDSTQVESVPMKKVGTPAAKAMKSILKRPAAAAPAALRRPAAAPGTGSVVSANPIVSALSEEEIMVMRSRALAAMDALRKSYPSRFVDRSAAAGGPLRTGPDGVKPKAKAGFSAKAKQQAAAIVKRAKDRQEKFSHLAPPRGAVLQGQRSMLERIKVLKTTGDGYKQAAQTFLDWIDQEQLRVPSVRQTGLAMLEYLDGLFLDGKGLGAIGTARAALLHIMPELQRHPDLVERLKDVQTSWERRAPEPTRIPLPKYAAFAIIGRTAQRGKTEEALGNCLQLRGYLRPSDLRRLKVKSLVKPSTVPTPGMGQFYGLVLNESQVKDPVPGKTGEYNESLLLDLPDEIWLGQALDRLCKGRDPEDSMFSFSATGYANQMRKSADECRLSDMGVTPYLWRHTGPSIDFLEKRHLETDIKRRARWGSDSSLRRYQKATLALRQASKVPTAILQYGKDVEKSLAQYMFGLAALPQPTWNL